MDNNTDRGTNRITACIAVLIILTVTAGFLAIGKDMQSVLRWELAGFIPGLALLPLTAVLFTGFSDRGYLFGRVIGLVITAYLQWLLSSAHILRFTACASVAVTLLSALAAYGIGYQVSRISDASDTEKSISVIRRLIPEEISLEQVLTAELIMLAVFTGFTWLFGHRIPSVETERVMDYAFMVTLDKTAYMPPLDVWAAGEPLNYYYFGLYLCTYLCKLSFVPVSEGYSLSLAMVATLCLVYSYRIVRELSGSRIGGMISAAAVTFCGNMHYIVFGWLSPMLWDILRLQGEKPTYWFASSTRYIGYIPENTADRTISEFPWYSFLIGDLHAHVTDIMIVLTIVALLVSYALREKDEDKPLLNALTDPGVIMTGILIGIAAMTNYWDFPIYYTVAGSIILFTHIRNRGLHAQTWSKTALQGIEVLLIAELVKLPFELKFDKMVNGIHICRQHSLIYQLVILWGLPTFILILFIRFLVKRYRGDAGSIKMPDIVALLLGLCGVGLALMPELIYVEDIYVEGFPRCNTMFKLSYEAFILLGLMSGYALIRLIKEKNVTTGVYIAAALLLATAGYAFTGGRQWYGRINEWNYKGIDATLSMRQDMGEEADVLEWIRDNTEGREVILTADGDSYTSACLISAISGHPTVLGWNTHEWLWHNSREYVDSRRADISTLYTSQDSKEVWRLIDRYDIGYIYVGPTEYERYGYIDIDRLGEYGRIVYRDNEIASVIIQIVR